MADEVISSRSRTLRQLIEQRLAGSQPSTDYLRAQLAGLAPDTAAALRQLMPATPTPAAVLMPIVERESGLTVLFTQRASQLRAHAGQISFPGGRIESIDSSPLEAALRETEEEIGLDRSFVTIAGYLDPYLIFTGYGVVPVVGFVRPGFMLRPDPMEVDEVFEVPLEFILDPANHQARERQLGEVSFQVHDIPFGDRHIWGATAGILMSFYRLVTAQ